VSTPNSYASGQCTWYMKNLYPDLPDDLGSAYEWLGNAAADGLHTVTSPAVDKLSSTAAAMVTRLPTVTWQR